MPARCISSAAQEQKMNSVSLRLPRSIAFISLLSLVGFGLLHSASAQEVSPPAPLPASTSSAAAPRRPRIGLALSGGGALGIAEIGVLQWMEENHIPVDRIAGTSMGSIIAAMYATGMSPAEMQKFAEGIDWDDALRSEPSYSLLSYRRKQDRRNFLINAPLGFKHGLNGPNGLNAAHGVGLLLDRISFSDSAITNFDDLPIPFRCVATDMISGEAVILSHGWLPRAVRASMAIPGVFTPVEMNGHLLADGGMVQNIPVETVRAMDADIIIAVQLRTPPGNAIELQSLTGVLVRAVSIMITQNETRSLAQAQATVSIDTDGFSSSDYDHGKDLIQLGYKTAAVQSAGLLQYAIQDPEEWNRYLAARKKRTRTSLKKVDFIEVTGADEDTDRRLQNQLNKALKGPLDLPRLDAELTRIAGRGQFDRLGYEGFTQNGVTGLRVITHEKSYGPPFLDLAVNVDGSGVGAFNFSAGGRVTFMDIANRGGEWRSDLLFGSSNLAATEFYQPLGQSRFFVAPFAFLSKAPRNSFSGLTRVAVFGDERAGGGFDVGYDSGLRSEIRFGYEIFSGRLNPLIGSAGTPIESGSTGEFRARYVWDGEDSPSVPSRGSRITAALSRVLQSPGQAHAITQFDVKTSTFVPLQPKTSLFLLASGGTSFGGSAGAFDVFSLGGPFRLGAYLPQEFQGNHYAYSAFGFRREFYRLPQIVGNKIYWGGWYEAGTAFGTAADNPGPVVVRGTFNLGVIADTFVGPIALAASASPTGQSRVNFSIGKLF